MYDLNEWFGGITAHPNVHRPTEITTWWLPREQQLRWEAPGGTLMVEDDGAYKLWNGLQVEGIPLAWQFI